MGYTTTFEGKLKLDKKLDEDTCSEIKKLNNFDPYQDQNPSYPELICQWIVADDKKHIVWDRVEKFYFFIEWLEYIIKYVLKPKNYILSGELIAEGDEDDDFGRIIITNNNVKYNKAKGKELEDHLKQREQEYAGFLTEHHDYDEKKIGKVLITDIAETQELNKVLSGSIYQLLNNQIFDLSKLYQIALVKEKDDSINLYFNQLLRKKENPNYIDKETLFFAHKTGDYIPLSSITEIIHYTSPLMQFILKSKHVYCICTNAKLSNKGIYWFRSNKIINKIVDFKQKNDDNLLFYESNDKNLINILILKCFAAIIFALVFYFSALMMFQVYQYLYINSYLITVPSFLFFGIGIPIYLYFFITIFNKFIWIVHPRVIFKTKTVSNSLKMKKIT